jgi:regulator of RNase E activity RraA
MSDRIKSIINDGTGVYSITKKEAGEIHKAAKKVKNHEVSYWTRNRKKKKESK